MLFHSIDFWIFFAVIFAVYFFVPQKIKWFFLLLASYFFYYYWGKEYVLLLVLPTLTTYVAARAMAAIHAPGWRRFIFWFSLTVSLGLLFVFKYFKFFRETLHELAGYFMHLQPLSPIKIILPIGISFFTFRMVSYLIDVYYQRIQAEKHLGIFALYVSFFPQLLAGPIDRAARLIPQFKKPVYFDWDRITAGFRLIVWGLFKKLVMAEHLALFVDQVFKNPDGQGINLIFAVYLYAFQFYCDFSGYSDMAIGISKVLGFNSIENFNFPYYAKSIAEFWNRWHISFSSWLRDYLFLPLAYATMRKIKGAKLLAVKAETWGYFVGISLTMLLGGLWHGAGWTFVIWGALFGMYQMVGYASKRLRKKIIRKIGLQRLPWIHSALSIFITFNLVSFAWIFFRAFSLSHALEYIGQIGFHFPGKGGAHLVFNLILLMFFLIIEYFYKNRDRIVFWQRFPRPVKMAFFAFFCCLLIVLAVDKSNEFIYFQF